MNTTDQRALRGLAGQTQHNATALTSSTAPTQTAQVFTFNARTLITASVYLLNWGAAPTSTNETVQVQDAAGTHTYAASNFNNGLWVSFSNLRVGPTQNLAATITGASGTRWA